MSYLTTYLYVYLLKGILVDAACISTASYKCPTSKFTAVDDIRVSNIGSNFTSNNTNYGPYNYYQCATQCITQSSACLSCARDKYNQIYDVPCGSRDYLILKFSPGFWVSSIYAVLTVGNCVPVSNVPSAIASSAITSYSTLSAINTIDCILRAINQHHKYDVCREIVLKFRNVLISMNGLSVAHDVAALAPFVGCALIPNKVALKINFQIAYQTMLSKWSSEDCYSATLSSCRCSKL